MNNKILARLIAAVMAIAMLGTVSFAASLDGVNIVAGANDYDGYSATDVKTLIAYVAADDATEPDATNIIAIAQENEGEYPSVKIDTAKLTENNIIIRFGGKENDCTTKVISIADNSGTVRVDESNIFVGSTEYTNVAYFEGSISGVEAGGVSSYGLKIQNNGGKANYFVAETALQGSGTYTYGVVLVGVPDANNWTASSFYTTAN